MTSVAGCTSCLYLQLKLAKAAVEHALEQKSILHNHAAAAAAAAAVLADTYIDFADEAAAAAAAAMMLIDVGQIAGVNEGIVVLDHVVCCHMAAVAADVLAAVLAAAVLVVKHFLIAMEQP